MLSLIIIIFGMLIAFVGLLMVAPQVRDLRISAAATGAWVFRGGALALLVGGAAAFLDRPPTLVLKLMLIAGALIALMGLAILPREWQQAEFKLDKSLSWQIGLLGLAVMLTALLFIEPITMVVGSVLAWLGVQYAKRQFAAGRLDPGPVRTATLVLQIVILVVTTALLIFK